MAMMTTTMITMAISGATAFAAAAASADVRAVGQGSGTPSALLVLDSTESSPGAGDIDSGLDDGHRRPVMGWSTWTTFKCAINETLILQSLDVLSDSPLSAAGYNYVLIDDCWTACGPSAGGGDECVSRDPKTGYIRPDPVKFPRGLAPLTAEAHRRGLKIGIYTSVGAVTCAGYTGSLHHEAVDASAFAEWGFDFVKHDTCMDDTCTVHNGCIQNATRRMREALWTEGRGRIVYALDHGNPSNQMKLWNPRNHHNEPRACVAENKAELVWNWLGAIEASDGDPDAHLKGPHLVKPWFDMKDDWRQTLSNAHQLVGKAEYHRCNQLLNPDMLTIGMGAQTESQYRAQFFLWAVLGAPLIMSHDVRRQDAATVALLTSAEVIDIAQDADCTMGSLVRHNEAAGETWLRPLSDGSFAAVLLNKGNAAQNVSVYIAKAEGEWGDFFPITSFHKMSVRDAYAKRDLGVFEDIFEAQVPAMDARIFRLVPVE